MHAWNVIKFLGCFSSSKHLQQVWSMHMAVASGPVGPVLAGPIFGSS